MYNFSVINVRYRIYQRVHWSDLGPHRMMMRC